MQDRHTSQDGTLSQDGNLHMCVYSDVVLNILGPEVVILNLDQQSQEPVLTIQDRVIRLLQQSLRGRADYNAV